MAYKTVLSASAREKIRDVLKGVAREKGNLYLGMLAQTLPEVRDRWTLIISAPWVESLGLRTIVSYLSSYLSQQLDRNALSTIDRILPMSRSEPFVERMLTIQPHSLAEPARHVFNWRSGDVPIPEGYIFVVDPHAQTKCLEPVPANRRVVTH